MRNVSITVYKFNELEEKAQKYAMDKYCYCEPFYMDEDYFLSINMLVKKFDGSITNWNIYPDNKASFMKFSVPKLTHEEISDILATLGSYDAKTFKGNGDCLLTGYGTDEDALDGFRNAFMGGNDNLLSLMEEAFKTWLEAYRKDYSWQYSHDGFVDFCTANDFEFDKYGVLYNI